MDVPSLPPRDETGHKGTYGRVWIVGGSRGMAGSVALCGMAAARSGAGLVTLAVPNRCLETVACYDPCYMTFGLADDDDGRLSTKASSELADQLTGQPDAPKNIKVGIGPGLSKSESVTQVVIGLYQQFSGAMVVDADALNAMAACPSGFENAGGPRILTPHVGEFRRIVGRELTPNACRERAVTLAQEHQLIILLKGHRTLVTDGQTTFENETGNPGMATGGSGDVLTGVITALLGQGLSPLDAAVLGSHVHGLAGDLACDEVGEVSMIASDILEYLPEAFQALD